jgi:CheY-like chemotaxis protein
VLTVDDDEAVVTLFRRYLERRGYRVFGLTRAQRVVEEAKRLNPYAITLDVLMPDRDGWEVIRELKLDPQTRDIPIIVCSVLGDTDKGLSIGVADYLVKPISEQDLLAVLGRIESPKGAGHVLVVDDSPGDRKLLRRLLEDAQYQVREASGGAEAIETIHSHHPDLVVLDLMMPGVDGFEVLETLKADRDTRHIPVVVVTAKELDAADRRRLMEGVEALLQKGLFDQEQLLNDIALALDRMRAT